MQNDVSLTSKVICIYNTVYFLRIGPGRKQKKISTSMLDNNSKKQKRIRKWVQNHKTYTILYIYTEMQSMSWRFQIRCQLQSIVLCNMSCFRWLSKKWKNL